MSKERRLQFLFDFAKRLLNGFSTCNVQRGRIAIASIGFCFDISRQCRIYDSHTNLVDIEDIMVKRLSSLIGVVSDVKNSYIMAIEDYNE